MAYGEDFIAETLALLAANDGNIALTAQQQGVSRTTVRQWRDKQQSERTSIGAAAKKVPRKKRDLAGKLEDLAHKALGGITEEKIKGTNAYSLALTAAVAIDKARLLRGESTAIEEQRHVTFNIVNARSQKQRTNGAAGSA